MVSAAINKRANGPRDREGRFQTSSSAEGQNGESKGRSAERVCLLIAYWEEEESRISVTCVINEAAHLLLHEQYSAPSVPPLTPCGAMRG